MPNTPLPVLHDISQALDTMYNATSRFGPGPNSLTITMGDGSKYAVAVAPLAPPPPPIYRIDLMDLNDVKLRTLYEGDDYPLRYGERWQAMYSEVVPGVYLQWYYHDKPTLRQYHPYDCAHKHGMVHWSFDATIHRYYRGFDINEIPSDFDDLEASDEETSSFANANDEYVFWCDDCDTRIPMEWADKHDPTADHKLIEKEV